MKTRHQRFRNKNKAAGFCSEHAKQKAVTGKTLCMDCLIALRIRGKKLHRELKIETIKAYGSICFCCGESRIEFLTIEHTKKDGTPQRKLVGGLFYRWLKKQGFPQNLGLAVLCFNCNCSRGFYGYCPHEKLKNEPN